MSDTKQKAQDPVVFISPYKQKSVNAPRRLKQQVIGGRVVEQMAFRTPFEFKDGRLVVDDPDDIEYLRNHPHYAPPGSTLTGGDFTELTDETKDKVGPQASESEAIEALQAKLDALAAKNAELEAALAEKQQGTNAPEGDVEAAIEDDLTEADDELEVITGVSNKQEAVEALAQAGVDVTPLVEGKPKVDDIVAYAGQFGYTFDSWGS